MLREVGQGAKVAIHSAIQGWRDGHVFTAVCVVSRHFLQSRAFTDEQCPNRPRDKSSRFSFAGMS